MEFCNSKEKEVVVDIESGEASHGANVKSDPISGDKWRKISLKKLVGGVLHFNGSADREPRMKLDDVSGGTVECPDETMELLVENNSEGQQGQGIVPIVKKDNEKERKKAGKVKKAPKPPRPPKGPSLDAADMRLIREISRIAMKKRERVERIKALKKIKATRLSSPSASLSSSSSSSGGTISAMIITILFILVIIFQGLSSSTSSNLAFIGAPQPAPQATGLTPVQFYKTVLSDDGGAPSFVPPKFME